MAAPFPSPTSTWHTKVYPSISPTRPELSARGKSVVVTGGGTGIGAETARSFAAAGASRIALLGRREQPLLDTKAAIEREFPDVDVFVAPTDVTVKSEVDAAFATFASGGGGGGDDDGVHILVSNAAVIGPREPIRDVDGDAWVEAVQKNIRGSLLVSQAFLRHAAAGAVAINVCSAVAHLNFVPEFSSYNVAKLAVFRLWDFVAFANPEVSVFHTQPGVVDTAMNKEAGGVGALGFEDDVSLPAGFHVWLASTEARFLKGKFLWVNWDVDELKARAKELEANSQLSIGLVGWPFQDADWALPATTLEPRTASIS